MSPSRTVESPDLSARLAGITKLACIGLTESLQRAVQESEAVQRTARGRLEEGELAELDSLTTRLQSMLAIVSGLRGCSTVAQNDVWSVVDCNQLLANIATGFDEIAHETGARISWNNLPRLHSIRSLLQLIFRELIRNAINYRSADAPEIRIEAGVGKESGLFVVQDNGIGIHPMHRESIFEPFYCVDPRSSRPGLGLTATRAAVQQLGGTIWVESNLRGGSSFMFRLPNPRA